MKSHRSIWSNALLFAALAASPLRVEAQQTQKPVLHGKEWVAITGKPLGATAGAMMFIKGGNAVDAAAAMLGATATMWDVLGWGGETQALIYNPDTGEVIGVNALGAAPAGATPEFFHEQGMAIPPPYGPLAAVTPGTPGGLMVMLAEYGRLSLAEVLEPAIDMARGYPIEAQTANSIEREKDRMAEWPYSRDVFLPHYGEERAAPDAGEIFVQEDLARTLEKLAEAEAEALAGGASRRDAIMTAYDRFYRGDIAEEFVRGSREQGGLHTVEDLANWQVYLEEPVMASYKGIDVYKLTTWVQGPVLLHGWVVSVTPSGGWIPAVIAGRTGIGMSQRMQSFVLDERAGPYNVVEPGKRPRATLTPSLALKDGRPFLTFAVQGGDGQDQNLLQFFLNVVEFGMNVQQAAEAANFNSYQMRSSFGAHEAQPGRILLNDGVPAWIRAELEEMGYDPVFASRTSGPINAIFFDAATGTMWGGSSNHGEDYGIAW